MMPLPHGKGWQPPQRSLTPSILDKHKVFEHIEMLFIGIKYSLIQLYPNLGKFILDDVSVEMIPLRYRWGCRTFQTASHIHATYILVVWTPWTVVDGHMAAHSHRYHHRGILRFGRAGWNPRQCQCGMIPLRYRWGCRTFQTASHIHVIHI